MSKEREYLEGTLNIIDDSLSEAKTKVSLLKERIDKEDGLLICKGMVDVFWFLVKKIDELKDLETETVFRIARDRGLSLTEIQKAELLTSEERNQYDEIMEAN